jgi:hypothetical protein
MTIYSFPLFSIYRRERTSKSVFSSISVKSHLVDRLQAGDIFIVATLSKKEQEQQKQQAKNGYWSSELESLGIEPKRKTELNDEEEELEKLADIIKQAMFQDYKVAYSEEDDAHKEEAQSTVTVG